MITYPEKYKRLLKEDEEVLWYKKGVPLLSKGVFIALVLFLGGVGVAFTICAISYGNTALIPFAVFFFFLLFGVNYYYYGFNNLHYVVTNHRIIRDNRPQSKFHILQTFYKSIHEINLDTSLGGNTIACYTMPRSIADPNGIRSAVFLPQIDNAREMLTLLQEKWMPLSPYQVFVDKFQAFAQNYNLDFEGFYPMGEKQILMQGEIDEMQFLFSLSELYDVKTMSISITCPNAEKNYLNIRKEKSIDSFGKLIGMQDLEIKNKEFDDTFLLQSDNRHFFEKILNTETQKNILSAAKLLNWQISLGVKPLQKKHKRTNKKGNDDILDADLALENPTIKERDESNITALIYQCDDLVKNSSNLMTIAEHCIINTKMMVELAKRIKNYNKGVL